MKRTTILLALALTGCATAPDSTKVIQAATTCVSAVADLWERRVMEFEAKRSAARTIDENIYRVPAADAGAPK